MIFSNFAVRGAALLAFGSGLLSFENGGVDALGCRGGDTFNCVGDECNGCNLNTITCDQSSCEGMGGEWTEDCPDYPGVCDPLSPSKEDPHCTGPPESIDRAGKKMYRRKLIDRHIPDDPSGAVFCHITVALCEGESSLTHKIDAGFGDYYRLQATEEWCDTTSFPGVPGTYSGMEECTGARSYSPVNPFNDQTAQFIIKEVVGKPSDYGCTGGVNCKFGFSELACNLPIGSDILMSKDPDHYGVQSTHLAYKPNFDRDPGNGPYTINYVGQGVALTELNPNGMSQLMKPFASDGNFSNIKEVNYLWANSYYSSAEWIYEKNYVERFSATVHAGGIEVRYPFQFDERNFSRGSSGSGYLRSCRRRFDRKGIQLNEHDRSRSEHQMVRGGIEKLQKIDLSANY